MKQRMKRLTTASIAGLALVPAAAWADGDFGLEYAVERVPAARLSVAQCAGTIRGAAQAAGYVTRSQQVEERLALHVSGPQGDGRALLAYCIQAGDLTVYVVQALDYAGPGGTASMQVKQRVVQALEKAARR